MQQGFRLLTADKHFSEIDGLLTGQVPVEFLPGSRRSVMIEPWATQETSVTESELITALRHQSQLGHRYVELTVSTVLEHISQTIAHGGRSEIRGEGDRFSISAVSMGTQ
jgi:hypothetical protein